MHIEINQENAMLVAITTIVLIFLQLIFAYYQNKNPKVFRKLHETLGYIIFLVILTNIILFPKIILIGSVVLALVLIQITIGISVKKGNSKLFKYHKPLGFFIFLLAIANIVLLLT